MQREQSSQSPPHLPLLRRSHLDSATYRSLVRIFSHCLCSLSSLTSPLPSKPGEVNPRPIDDKKDPAFDENSGSSVPAECRNGGHEVGCGPGGNINQGGIFGSFGEAVEEDGRGLPGEGDGDEFLREDELGLLKIQKELSECIRSELPGPVKVQADANDGDSVRVEEVGCKERPDESSERSCDSMQEEVVVGNFELSDPLREQPVLGEGTMNSDSGIGVFDGCNNQKSNPVRSEAEISGQVEELGGQVQIEKYVLPGKSSEMSGSKNSGDKMVTGTPKTENDAELEDGEILNEYSNLVQLSELESEDGEIGREKFMDYQLPNDTDREENTAVHAPGSFNSKGNCISEHELAGNIDSRSGNSRIVDYSDIYGFDGVSENLRLLKPTKNKKGSIRTKKGGNIGSRLPKNKKGLDRTKRDENAKLLDPPNDKKGNNRMKKDDRSDILFPAREISEKPPISNKGKESNLKDDNKAKMDAAADISVPARENPEDFQISNEGKLCKSEDVEVQKKKIKGPLTEERKAKRKVAKKRKRAEQNRKLGIKRLKLQPVSMPKKVIYCNFYLKGRCQQGDLCKFSHDTTPLTKSQPCKYFACQSCLKGDDCPFDHELWKYPCHNFMSTGTCIRGEACKFSHKMPSAEVASAETALSKPGISMPSEGPSINSAKQMNTNNSSSKLVNSLPVNANTPKSAVMHAIEKVVEKPPVKVPKGIRFLSFGQNLSEDASKSKSKFSAGKLLKSNELPEVGSSSGQNTKSVVDVRNTVQSWAQKPLSSAESFSSFVTSGIVKPPVFGASAGSSKQAKISNIGGGQDSGPSSRSTGSGGNDATKLLEEFLFCGGI